MAITSVLYNEGFRRRCVTKKFNAVQVEFYNNECSFSTVPYLKQTSVTFCHSDMKLFLLMVFFVEHELLMLSCCLNSPFPCHESCSSGYCRYCRYADIHNFHSSLPQLSLVSNLFIPARTRTPPF